MFFAISEFTRVCVNVLWYSLQGFSELLGFPVMVDSGEPEAGCGTEVWRDLRGMFFATFSYGLSRFV